MGPLSTLNHYFWKYKYLFIPGLLFTMMSAGFQIAVPMVVRQAIDSIPRFVRLYNVFEHGTLQSSLYVYFFSGMLIFALAIVALTVISGIFKFLMRQTVVVASRHIEYDLRNELYDHLQKLSPAFYQQYSTGDVITRSTDDIEKVRRYIGPAIMYVTRSLMMVLIAVSVMFVISPRLTLYALAPMPLLAVAVFFMAHMVHTRSDRLQQQYSTLTSRIQEALAGMRVLKAYTREPSESKALNEESETYKWRNLDLALVEAAWRPAFLLIVGMSTIIVVWMGGQMVMDGAITIGNIAEYIIYVNLMTWPVASLGFVITMIQRASASVIRLNKILDTEPAIADSDQTNPSISDLKGEVTFRNVSFQYEDEEVPALDRIHFELPANGTLAVVGRTGAGKTTLVEMIPRFLDPDSGTVEIDGHDVRSIPLDTLREHIGYVPQDVFLFSDTVANNIAFGALDADRSAIEEAAREADLLGNVQDFSDGFDTYVGERGITLSGGQKQRTSIARALIRNPRILIFDDALSAVDTRTEQRILKRLRKRKGNQTLIIVTHRMSAVKDADLILVMDEGRIVQKGTHKELIDQDGLYATLCRKQELAQEIESMG
ncbi:ABC transporter ATP-binding protein [Longimonas halophila]|uniref:ABC transporter ATP-binding protein n=1 Tax=Longimonas halophila TaxID=1469170 RepID=A0A2H3NTS6_9BACT|nr:ABC transporter ATP-binding protein [Longimonas halophila]PEN07691.1 ABC transporter ATP-binding protein [Longimonas halophila]